MFIRRHTHGTKFYYTLVENYRQNGKRFRRTVCNLGQHATIEGAIAHVQKEIDAQVSYLRKYRVLTDKTYGWYLRLYKRWLKELNKALAKYKKWRGGKR